MMQNILHSIALSRWRERSNCLSHLHHQKHNRESHFGRFGDEVHRHRMVREAASGIFRQVDKNGLQTDEEAVRGDQAEREQTLLIIIRRDFSLAAGALLVMKFVRERRLVLVVERPPAVGGEGRHRPSKNARRCVGRLFRFKQRSGRWTILGVFERDG
tara:strand:- start:1887 stop:2360 length:474 start_codon:yes stop_codon:yes gene_type:complete